FASVGAEIRCATDCYCENHDQSSDCDKLVLFDSGDDVFRARSVGLCVLRAQVAGTVKWRSYCAFDLGVEVELAPQISQIDQEILRGLVTLILVFSQTLRDDLLQSFRKTDNLLRQRQRF